MSAEATTDAAVRWQRLPLTADQRLRGLDLLSAAELERYRRAHDASERADGFLLGRLLLRDLVGDDRVITAACPACGEEHGRPATEGFFLSVAHAHGVVFAASGRTPVGIDVELTDATVPPEFAADVAEWTVIEAVLKADGRGLDLDPGAVVIDGPTASVGCVRYRIERCVLDEFTIAVARAEPSR